MNDLLQITLLDLLRSNENDQDYALLAPDKPALTYEQLYNNVARVSGCFE